MLAIRSKYMTANEDESTEREAIRVATYLCGVFQHDFVSISVSSCRPFFFLSSERLMTKPPVVRPLRLCWHNVAFPLAFSTKSKAVPCSVHGIRINSRNGHLGGRTRKERKKWESSRTIWHIDKVPFEFMLTIWDVVRHVSCNLPRWI